jgi:GTP cyclohydrolase IA
MTIDPVKVQHAVSRLVGAIDDPAREGLQQTPARVARFYAEWLDAPEPTFTTFENDGSDEVIVQRGIPFYSLCEHHMLPFFGTACIAYLPGARIVGLSKLARAVQWRAQRLQNQERITTEVADLLQQKLDPRGVAVLLRARHMCMEMRGVRTADVETVTSCVRGVFRDDPRSRAEFLSLVGA